MQFLQRPKNLALVAFLMLLPWFAEASSFVPGSAYKSVLARLRGAGVDRVGEFKVSEFERKARSIRWRSIPGRPASVESGERASAYFRKNEVFISRDLPGYAISALPQLELHEALGATGYDDSDYALSTTLVNLSGLQSGSEITAILREFDRVPRTRFAGGSSVVGGGDLSVIQIKQNILGKLSQQGGYWKSAAFLSLCAQINFEPVSDANQTTVSLNFRQEKGRRGQVSVYVPMTAIEQGSTSRQTVEDEAARRIMELYSNSGSADQNVRAIQDAMTRTGRSAPIAPDESSYSLTAGEAAGGSELKEAGNYYFDCSFLYEGQNFQRRLVIAAGASIQSSVEWGLDPGSTLRGTIGVYPGGKIVQTFILYRAKSGDAPRVQQGRVIAGRSASTSMIIDGRNVTFTCERQR